MKPKGTVYLVGAGPGDAGLLTLRAAELLARADVVVYDAPVNSDILRLASKPAELLEAGKVPSETGGQAGALSQLLVTSAHAGKTVVRLIGGDPYFFGGGGEEAEQLAAAHVPFEVVPGVSALVAAPNYAGVPLTHRAFASQLTFLTGHPNPAQAGVGFDWAQVSKAPGTKVITLAPEHIGQLAELLMGHGLAADTPVAVVGRGANGHQRSLESTLSAVGGVVARERIGSPAVAVVGSVVKLRNKLNWFERRPLFGQRVVVTRAREQAGHLGEVVVAGEPYKLAGDEAVALGIVAGTWIFHPHAPNDSARTHIHVVAFRGILPQALGRQPDHDVLVPEMPAVPPPVAIGGLELGHAYIRVVRDRSKHVALPAFKEDEL